MRTLKTKQTVFIDAYYREKIFELALSAITTRFKCTHRSKQCQSQTKITQQYYTLDSTQSTTHVVNHCNIINNNIIIHLCDERLVVLRGEVGAVEQRAHHCSQRRDLHFRVGNIRLVQQQRLLHKLVGDGVEATLVRGLSV